PESTFADGAGPDAPSMSPASGDAGDDGGSGPSAPADQPYPRIGVLGIGGGQSHPSADWEFYGRVDVVIMGANYETRGTSGRDREAIVQGIKNAMHPAGAAPAIPTRIFNYVMFGESQAEWDVSRPILYNAINDNKWWLYQSTFGGTIAQSGNGDTSPAIDF